MRYIVAILVVCVCAVHAAHGGVIASAQGSGWTEEAWTLTGQEYRWPAAAMYLESSADTWKPGIGKTIEMTEGAAAMQAALEWGTAGDDAVEPVDFAASGAAADSRFQYVHVNTSEGLLSEMDFILEGNLIFDWTGAVAGGEEDMGMHVQMTQIPEPASFIMVILASLSGMFIRRRFR